MRGKRERQEAMLLGVTTDDFVPVDHPIRRIKPIVERALTALSPSFTAMYAAIGRPSIPPEHLLKGSLLIALYSLRGERQLCERLQYDLLFKWFLDLNIQDKAFDPSTFSKNRDRLLEHEVTAAFFDAVLDQARERRLLSDDHFTVDGTLLESWASLKSFKPRPSAAPEATEAPAKPSRPATSDTPREAGAASLAAPATPVALPAPAETAAPPAESATGRNPTVDFHGEKRSNATHHSTTDPEARLARKGKGKEAKLCLAGHVLMENRNGLAVDILLTQATGMAEREAALALLDRRPQSGHAVTLGADKGYDTRDFVAACRARRVTPHVAQNTSGRRSAIDGRTTRHAGYGISQRIRKRVEEIFGWAKTVGGARKLRYLGVPRNQCWAELTLAAYNLIRMSNLEARAA